MKKIILSLALVAGAFILGSCDSKVCVCYQQVNGVMTMNDTYTDVSMACVDLSNSVRVCVEESERMDPGQIANPFKK